MDRSTADADLTFRGFLCLTSPLKPGTRNVIQHLQASGHKCVIITGDNVLTTGDDAACWLGRVGILGG